MASLPHSHPLSRSADLFSSFFFLETAAEVADDDELVAASKPAEQTHPPGKIKGEKYPYLHYKKIKRNFII